MHIRDFQLGNVKYISITEIEQTGAKLESVDKEIVFAVDKLRGILGVPIYLCVNGITTGDHKSKEHKEGKAIDVFIKQVVPFKKVVYSALSVGIKGIGVYYNMETGLYSYHFDIGEIRFWRANKIHKTDSWTYGELFNDPKNN